MSDPMPPTPRELEILKVLWEKGEASVREVYETLRERLPIVQNTVQAFLRTMEEKGLVSHRLEGRTFIYKATRQREQTGRGVVGGVLDRVFDGALDQLVASALAVSKPSPSELERLRALIDEAERKSKRGAK